MFYFRTEHTYLEVNWQLLKFSRIFLWLQKSILQMTPYCMILRLLWIVLLQCKMFYFLIKQNLFYIIVFFCTTLKGFGVMYAKVLSLLVIYFRQFFWFDFPKILIIWLWNKYLLIYIIIEMIMVFLKDHIWGLFCFCSF